MRNSNKIGITRNQALEDVFQKIREKEKIKNTLPDTSEDIEINEKKLKDPKEKAGEIIRKDCSNLRLTPCPNCMKQICACKIEKEKGIFILRDHCKNNCKDYFV